MFDVAFFTRLLATDEVVSFGEESKCSELEHLVRERMTKYVGDKRVKLMQEKGGKKSKVFQHYIKVTKKMCKANQGKDQVRLWLKLFCWMVMSGLLFFHILYGTAWGV